MTTLEQITIRKHADKAAWLQLLLSRSCSHLALSRCGGFKRFSAFVSGLVVATLLSSTCLLADPTRFDARNNRLGLADSTGYVRIVRELGHLPLADGREYPLRLIFNTNPAQEPGAFGPHWHSPLFSSTVVQTQQYRLYWDGPRETRHFFIIDRQAPARHGMQVFHHRGGDWTATIGRNRETRIESTRQADWYYVYREGRLQEFRKGSGSAVYRITYSGRGQPLYITDANTNRRVLEIHYERGIDPVRMRIGELDVRFQMADADMTGPDGRTPWRNYRLRFLSAIEYSDGTKETFTYSRGQARQRTVPLINDSGQREAQRTRSINAAINRMAINSDGNYVEWEAQSGFITADPQASYTIVNPSWDPHQRVAREADRPAPRMVSITRQEPGKRPAVWSYDWARGIRTVTDPETGIQRRNTYITAEGPAHLQLRRREVNKGNGWEVVEQRSYDSMGRMIRRMASSGLQRAVWTDTEHGSIAEVFENERLIRKDHYEGNRLIGREIHKQDGNVERWRYENIAGRRMVTQWLNGDLVSQKRYTQNGELDYMRWADGREQFWSRNDGPVRVLTIYADGRRHLIERAEEGGVFTRVTDATKIDTIHEFLRNNH